MRECCHANGGRLAQGANRSYQATPRFFCRLVDEVVYWNTSRLRVLPLFDFVRMHPRYMNSVLAKALQIVDGANRGLAEVCSIVAALTPHIAVERNIPWSGFCFISYFRRV